MSYSLIIGIPKDHKLTAWLPVGRGLLRFIKVPARTLIPKGRLEIAITRGSGIFTGQDGATAVESAYEAITYKWLDAPRRDVWWATGRPYTITTKDPGEYSELITDAAHGNHKPLLCALFARL